MRIKILGCSGGIGPGLRTTSLLVDDDILIDAGTGVGDLSLSRMRRIQHIYLTHGHLDHVCGLALMADNLFGLVKVPLQVHATEPTLKAIRDHVFNWSIWPDFGELPSRESPILAYQPVTPLRTESLGRGRSITAFPVVHTVPAVGYSLNGPSGQVFAFSGDTSAHALLWDYLNGLPRVDQLMIEIAFPNEQSKLSQASHHFTPSGLAAELGNLRHRPRLLLTHHKPGTEARIREQCRTVLDGWEYRHLKRGDVLEL